jgi:hypothetical protein
VLNVSADVLAKEYRNAEGGIASGVVHRNGGTSVNALVVYSRV